MKYPLVPLVNELTFPLLFFWFCLPFVMLLIIAIIWLQLLLTEAQMPGAEKIKKEFSEEPDSDSKFGDEPTEEDSQNDPSSVSDTREEMLQSGRAVETLRPKPAYLSSYPKSQKQSFFAASSDTQSQGQEIRSSYAERSSVTMLLCTTLSSLTWSFICPLIQISNILRTQLLPSSLNTYMDQLGASLGDKVMKILSSLRLKRRGPLALVFGRKLEQSDEAQSTTSG